VTTNKSIANSPLPDSLESYSSVTGSGVFFLDLSTAEMGAGQYATLAGQLAALPCPTVLKASRQLLDQSSDLISLFDVVVDPDTDEAPLIQSICQNPQASALLVQVLRHNENASVESGLLMESTAFSTLQAGEEFKRWLTGQDVISGSEDTQEDAVKVERHENQLVITLCQPGNRNAFSRQMRDALYEALTLLEHDCSILSCVIRGEGSCFCVGGDLTEFGTASNPATAHLIRHTRSVPLLLSRHAEKITCEVHSACIGSGIELPAFAGTLVAKKNAFFQLPEVAMGLIPGAGGTVSILKRIGRQRMAEWVISGRKIKAKTALEWGLVDRLVD
jgi:enoyl-CoA hydratase/carnithine racemase